METQSLRFRISEKVGFVVGLIIYVPRALWRQLFVAPYKWAKHEALSAGKRRDLN